MLGVLTLTFFDNTLGFCYVQDLKGHLACFFSSIYLHPVKMSDLGGCWGYEKEESETVEI